MVSRIYKHFYEQYLSLQGHAWYIKIAAMAIGTRPLVCRGPVRIYVYNQFILLPRLVREAAKNIRRGGGPSFFGGVRTNFDIFGGGTQQIKMI